MIKCEDGLKYFSIDRINDNFLTALIAPMNLVLLIPELQAMRSLNCLNLYVECVQFPKLRTDFSGILNLCSGCFVCVVVDVCLIVL